MPRKKIPRALERKILVDFRHQCAVCYGDDIIIHHIDKDNTNNDEENLIVLCNKCHDKAHSKSDLSKDLTEYHLKEYRIRAIEERNVAMGVAKITKEYDELKAEIKELSELKKYLPILKTIKIDGDKNE